MGFGTSGGSVGALGPVQPFKFATSSFPATVAKKTTILLSTARAEHNLAIPVGRNAGMRAGKIFQFKAAGIMSTGSVQGRLMISPFYGAGTSAGTTGIALGPSPEQGYASGLVNVPWRLSGELVFRSVSLLASSSTVWCTGTFLSAGDPSIEGSGLSIPFGSIAPITIDSRGPVGFMSGALNISATFSAAQVTASISAQYAYVRSF
jgi:hypothetical protein